MWNIKTNVKHEVLFEALQAGSEDKAAHSKFILASLAKKEVFVLMLSESLNQKKQTTDVPNPK